MNTHLKDSPEACNSEVDFDFDGGRGAPAGLVCGATANRSPLLKDPDPVLRAPLPVALEPLPKRSVPAGHRNNSA